MIKKIYFLIGMAVGAVIVWAFTHEARKLLEHERRVSDDLASLAKEAQINLATAGAIDGKDYLDDEYWEQELKRWQDDDNAETA